MQILQVIFIFCIVVCGELSSALQGTFTCRQ
uniref:Uncharacterized protein n=1 Tax=Anguilla anguilla TaxID=7936 RepID=A0A0E9QF83_ANGAN